MPSIYFTKLYNETESFYKIGFTKHKNIEERFKTIPYQYTLLTSFVVKDESDAYIAEQSLLKDFGKKYFNYTPKNYFSGIGECFVGGDDSSMKSDFEKTVKRIFKVSKNNTLLLEIDKLTKIYNEERLNQHALEFIEISTYDRISSVHEINEYTNFLINKFGGDKPKKKKKVKNH